MRKLILMIVVFLYVDKPVASLQFDAVITGTVTLVTTINKQVATANIGSSGKTRVIVYGLNQDVFSGKFGEVSGNVSDISNVVGADAEGRTVVINVKTLSQPKDVKVSSSSR